MAGIVMFGLAHTFEEGKHIRIELLTSRLTARGQIIVNIIVTTLSLIALSLLVWVCMMLVLDSYRLKSISLSGLDIPIAIPQAVLPLGLCGLALVLAKYLIEQIAILSRSR